MAGVSSSAASAPLSGNVSAAPGQQLEADRRGRQQVHANLEKDLSAAILEGRVDTLAQLLRAVPHLKKEEGARLILTAVTHRQVESLKLVLAHLKEKEGEQASAIVNSRDERNGEAALQVAVRLRCRDTVLALLEAGAWPDQRDHNGVTPVMRAAKRGASEIVNLLLYQEKGRALHLAAETDSDMRIALHYAAEAGDEATVQVLLKAAWLYNWHDLQGVTPLMKAVESGALGVVNLLLDHAKESGDVSDLLTSVDNVGRPVLHYAAAAGNEDMVRVLLTAGARIDSLDDKEMTPLMKAAQSGAADVIALILQHARTFFEAKNENDPELMFREFVEIKDINEQTVLHHAAMARKPDAVKVLLEAGANLNARDSTQKTPLMKAAESGAEEIVDLLLAWPHAGDEDIVEAQDEDNRTALHHAARAGKARAVKALLKAGADWKKKDHQLMTLLMAAADGGCKEVVELFCKRMDAEAMRAKDEAGRTALHYAAEAGEKDAAEVLLEAGAELNIGDKTGMTPLLSAARNGQTALVGLLLDRMNKSGNAEGRKPIDETDHAEWTALHHAAWGGDDETVRVLLEAGVDMHARTSEGSTPLMVAAAAGRTGPIIQLLAGKNGDDNWAADETDGKGFTALHLAVREKHRETVRALLEAGVNPNIEAKNTCTPLLEAVMLREDSVLEELLAWKTENPHLAVRVDEENKAGQTALFGAVMVGNTYPIQSLLEAGADPNRGDKMGRTPLMWAASFANWDSLRQLLGWKDSDGALVINVNAQDHEGCSALHHAVAPDPRRLRTQTLAYAQKLAGQGQHAALQEIERQLKSDLVNQLLIHTDRDGHFTVDVNIANKKGVTPLHVAADAGENRLVESLMNRGAEIYRKTKDGSTAPHLALQKGYMEIVKMLLAFPPGKGQGNLYGAAPLHAFLPLLKKNEAECGGILGNFYSHLVEWELGKLRSEQERISAPASISKRERSRLKQEMEQTWERFSFDARKIRVLESWTEFHAPEPEVDPSDAAARKAQSRMRMRNTRLSSHTNLYLGTLLAKEEQGNKAVRREEPAQCAKDARFRLTLALEQALQGCESLNHVKECAQQLLGVAPQEKAFSIGGVTWLASELKELADDSGEPSSEAEGAARRKRTLAASIELAHNMANTLEEGRPVQAHQGGYLLMSQDLLEEVQRRNAEKGPRPRKAIAAEKLQSLASLRPEDPFSSVFHTGIYWEYETALRKNLHSVRDYLAAPSEEKLESLAKQLQAEILHIPLESVLADYQGMRDPDNLTVLREELEARRELPEIKRIVEAIRLELELGPEIQALIHERIFENEDEAWEKIALDEEGQKLVQALIDKNKCASPIEARRLLQELVRHETLRGNLVQEMTADRISRLHDDLSKALGAARTKNLVRELTELGVFADRAAILDALLAGFDEERMDEMIALGLFESRADIAKFQASPEHETLVNGLRKELEIRNEAGQTLGSQSKEVLLDEITGGRCEQVDRDFKESLQSFPESEKLLARLIEKKVFASREAARKELLQGDKENVINQLITLKLVEGRKEADDAWKGLLRSERLIERLVEGEFFSSADAARAALEKPDGKIHVDQLIARDIALVRQRTSEDLDMLKNTEPKLVELLGEGGVFRDRDEAQRHLENLWERNWYWDRSGVRAIDSWLKERHPGSTLREVALKGLNHTFFKSRPTQDKKLHTDTHTTVQTIWDYCASKGAEKRRNLEKSFLEKLLDIGQDPMCNTVCVEKVLATPNNIDLTLTGSIPSVREMETMYGKLRPHLPDLAEEFEEILSAPGTGRKRKDRVFQLDAAQLRKKVAWQKAMQELEDWSSKNKPPLEDIKKRLNQTTLKLREINEGKGNTAGLPKLAGGLRNLNAELLGKYSDDYVSPGNIVFGEDDDPVKAAELLGKQATAMLRQVMEKEREWNSPYWKELDQRKKKLEESRARLEKDGGIQEAREFVKEVQSALNKQELMEYVRRRSLRPHMRNVAERVERVVKDKEVSLPL